MLVKVRSFAAALLLLGAAGSALSCASAGSDPSVAQIRSSIAGGEADSKDSSVFLFVSHRTGGVALCTASLIAPNLLLTARHCVSEVTEGSVECGQTTASAPFAAKTFYATNSPSEDDAKVFYLVSSVSVPSDGSYICGYDLALVTLTTVVPADVATPLVPRIDLPVSVGESYRAVGYGLDAAGDAGTSGTRRMRAGLKVECVAGKCGQGVDSSEFAGGAGLCSGDSGGPALDAAGRIVGVASRSADGCARPIYGSVASWKDWLVSVATQAAVQGKYSAPFWVKSGLSVPTADPVDAGAGAGPLGTQGDKCVGPEGCQPSFACFSPTSLASDGYCAASCKEQAQCATGTTCQPGVNVCVASPRSEGSASSCAVSALRKLDGGANAAMLAFIASALLGLKRRRASQSKRFSCH